MRDGEGEGENPWVRPLYRNEEKMVKMELKFIDYHVQKALTTLSLRSKLNISVKLAMLKLMFSREINSSSWKKLAMGLPLTLGTETGRQTLYAC